MISVSFAKRSFYVLSHLAAPTCAVHIVDFYLLFLRADYK